MNPAAAISGELYIFVAFDWGDEIDLEKAGRQVPSSQLALARRRRTPSSFFFKPAPLHITLEPVPIELAELGAVAASAGATVFDFGAVSLALRVPFCLDEAALLRLAGTLAEPSVLVRAARQALEPLYRQLLPAIRDPEWLDNHSEEYFVFRLSLAPDVTVADYLTAKSDWLSGLVHLESGQLSREEAAEALRLHLSYSPDDLLVPDWAAAVLVDRDCDETLQVIEFANLQLLEFRHIDNRLDDNLAAAARIIQPLTRSRFPFWRTLRRPLWVLGELKVEANGLFERTGNVLKLVGDPYAARVYRLLATRFHLQEYEESIRRNLELAEGIYQVLADQTSAFRAEFMELIIIFLILFEIVMAFVGH